MAVFGELSDFPLPDVTVEDALPPTMSTETITVPAAPEVLTTPTLLRIVHPPEGARLPYIRSSFVYGSADPKGKLLLNGQSVAIHPEGGFLAMVAYSTGTFTIKAELILEKSTVTVMRRVNVAAPPIASPVSPLTVEYVKPESAVHMLPGERLALIAKGSPGMSAHFQIEGVRGKFPMTEDAESFARGIYRGYYVVQPDDDVKDAWIRVTLTDPKKGTRLTHEASGRLTRLDDQEITVVAVATETAVLRAGPSIGAGDKAGYFLFPPAGVRLQVVGRRGSEVKVRLSESRTAWISDNEVRQLPAGTPPPQTAAGSISVIAEGRSTQVRVALGQRVPFLVTPAANGNYIDVTFFGVVSNTDWIHYDSNGGSVSLVEWFQDETDSYRVRVRVADKSWWGYDARYAGSTFVLELRSPPKIGGRAPLKGLRVALDAGHSSDRGAIGPTGLVEKDANWYITQCLQKKLVESGAEVVLIREADQHVGLYDRPKLAWQQKADILVSMHNNALPEGGNPFERNGYGVYYFHPKSYGLARQIHRAYGEVLGSRSGRSNPRRDDGLHYGNLALPRTPQMPAVLTESAYVILPEEESLLKTQKFQCDCAEAMLRGVERFVKEFAEEEPVQPAKKKSR